MKNYVFSRLSLTVAAGALALSACAINSVGDAALDTGSALGNEQRVTPEEEFPGVRNNCRLPGAVLSRLGNGWRLSLPAEVYAARQSQPTASRISCITGWARQRGLNLAIEQTRPR